MYLIAFCTANAQTSIPYSGGLITIDSLKAQRIQTDLLQLQTFKEMAKINEHLFVESNFLRLEQQKNINTQSARIATLEREKKILKRRLALKTLEIWVYRVGIVAGTYFLLKN